MDQIAI